MELEKIKIISEKGKIYYRKATITEWIGNSGKQFATAQSGNTTYHVVDRDFDGPIFASKRVASTIKKEK